MNPRELNEAYEKRKDKFHNFISNIKSKMEVDVFSIINPTLIKNPYNTDFPKKFFLQEFSKKIIIYQFLKSTLIFYIRQLYYLISYFISFLLFKIYYKKNKVISKNNIGIDIFFLVEKIIKDNKFNENYFTGLYDVLEKYNQEYIFIPRLYGITKNPFKLIKFFKIINQDKRNFLFEFELLSFKDCLVIIFMIAIYPFKTLKLLQNEKFDEDILFNNELIKDIGNIGFDSFSRYIFGKNISKSKNIKKIYSWSEFQVIERSFNYAIRTNNDDIYLIACQFYNNIEVEFNTIITDLDYKHCSSPHTVLVNGKYYLLEREKIIYKTGVALRYKELFSFKSNLIEKHTLLLGSYNELDTKYMLKIISSFDNIIFKNHPAINISRFGKLPTNITVSNDNIYKLFESAELVIGTASGTSVEAVACGVSVIIIASHDNLTANPLIEYGKGKIWDIAFSKDDVKRLYNQLTEYRKNNLEEIQNIAKWYRGNFFIEPTEENIVKAFELDKD